MKNYAIYGPPGTGKTTELMRILRELVDRNDARVVYFLSHTRSAAREAFDRAQGNIALPDGNICTIHSLVYRLSNISNAQVVTPERLREFGEEIGVPITARDPSSDEGVELGDELLAIYNFARSRMDDPTFTYNRSLRPGSPSLYKFVWKSYEEWKSSNGFLDFDDFLIRFINTPKISDHDFGARAFIVDEAQDLSPLQWGAFRKLSQYAQFSAIAGDDDQAIFLWGGADPEGMQRFERTNASRRKILEQSYRVPACVHRVAQSIISPVRGRVEKDYRPRDEEGTLTGPWSSVRHLDLGAEDTLILYRNYSIRKDIERDLLDMGVPYRADSGPPSPLDSKYARAARALLKWQREGVLFNKERSLVESLLIPGRVLEDTVVRKGSWRKVLRMPTTILDYLSRVGVESDGVRVRLSSIHQAKGREADRVVLCLGMTERTLAGMVRDPDAEARVFYVGATRARHRLDLVEGQNSYPMPLEGER